MTTTDIGSFTVVQTIICTILNIVLRAGIDCFLVYYTHTILECFSPRANENPVSIFTLEY